MKLPRTDYVAARSCDEALALLGERPDAVVLAGGQSLVPALRARHVRARTLVDIGRIEELQRIEARGRRVRVGAAVNHEALRRWGRAHGQPILDEVGRWIGHVAVRNRGTVCGSIAAGEPAAEWGALGLACDATLSVAGAHAGTHAFADVVADRARLQLGTRALVTHIEFELPAAGSGWAIEEVALREGDAAWAGAVVVLEQDGAGRIGAVRVGLLGLGADVRPAPSVAAALLGGAPTPARLEQAARRVTGDIDPVAVRHAAIPYKTALAPVVVERALARAAAGLARAAA